MGDTDLALFLADVINKKTGTYILFKLRRVMMIRKIRLKNFRSFVEEEIDINNITCVIGPNESGKSNLLHAINHLSSEKQNKPFEFRDLRFGTKGYPDGEIAIEYVIKLTNSLISQFIEDIPSLKDKYITLIKKGILKQTPNWSTSSDFKAGQFPDIVKINSKRAFVNTFKNDDKKDWAKKCSMMSFFIRNSKIDLRKKPFKDLIDSQTITKLQGEKKVNFIEGLLKNLILRDIKIFFWKYDEENYLKDRVPIDEFIKKPQKYPTVFNMFKICGWDKNDLFKKLQNLESVVYKNILEEEIEASINKIIKKNWTTHKNLKIKIDHKGDHLYIYLKEPGSSVPPEFRSDGLKWFLTFLINFKAKSEDIDNYILLIDEPGLYLHPKGQKDVLFEIESLSAKNQIIFTTHQTFLINKNHSERIRIIFREIERKGETARKSFLASKVTNKISKKNILGDSLLRESLGFTVSDISPINEKNILVEGVFDKDVFLIANKYWKIIDLNQISIIPCYGAPKISIHSSLYRSNDLIVVCFYDSDQPGQSAFSKNKSVKSSMKKQLKDYINNNNTSETMEDLIPEGMFNDAYERWINKFGFDREDITIPRMKNIDNLYLKTMDKEEKIEKKHYLEDFIIASLKKDFKKYELEMEILKNILKSFKSLL